MDTLPDNLYATWANPHALEPFLATSFLQKQNALYPGGVKAYQIPGHFMDMLEKDRR